MFCNAFYFIAMYSIRICYTISSDFLYFYFKSILYLIIDYIYLIKILYNFKPKCIIISQNWKMSSRKFIYLYFITFFENVKFAMNSLPEREQLLYILFNKCQVLSKNSLIGLNLARKERRESRPHGGLYPVFVWVFHPS